MKEFKDLQFENHPMNISYDPVASSFMGMFGVLAGTGSQFGEQAKMFFDNGYGVSVVTGSAAYDAYEVAVIKGDEENFTLCYDTPVTDDVVPCSDEDEVSKIMKQVQEL